MKRVLMKAAKRVLTTTVIATMLATCLPGMLARADEANEEATYTAWSEGKSNQPLKADGSVDEEVEISIPSYYVKENKEGASRILAYCLNRNRLAPEPLGNESATMSSYKRIKVSGASINAYIGTGKPPFLTGDALRMKLMAILGSGYQGSVSGIAKEKGLTNDGEGTGRTLFRMATQLAIWHYTNNVETLSTPAGAFLDALGIDVTEGVGKVLFEVLHADPGADLGEIEGYEALSDVDLALLKKIEIATSIYEALKEVSVSEQYAKHHTLYIYQAPKAKKTGAKDPYQNLISLEGIVEDSKQPVTFSKQDANNSEEIEGATLTVYEGEGTDGVKIKEWVSKAGQSEQFEVYTNTPYTMVEQQAPEYYVEAESITFKVDDEGKVWILENGEWVAQENATVLMKDKRKEPLNVKFSKTALGQGTELEGAELSIIDTKTGKYPVDPFTKKEIAPWISGGGVKEFGLFPGEYKLVEDQAPKGYQKAEEIEFRVVENEDGTYKLEIKEVKKDENGKETTAWVSPENTTVHMVDEPEVVKEEPKDTPTEEKPKDPKPEEPEKEDPKPEEPKKEDPKPEEPGKEEPKPEEPKTEETKPEEPKEEDPKPEEPKEEDPKPEEPETEEPKPEEPETNDPTPEEAKEDPQPEDPAQETQPAPVPVKTETTVVTPPTTAEVLGANRTQTVEAAQVLGESRSPQTADPAPIALLIALFGAAAAAAGFFTYRFSRSEQ